MDTLRSTIALLLFLFATSASAGILGQYDQVYVFGDSFSDNGNVAALLPPALRETPPYSSLNPTLVPGLPYDGTDRFSNGPVWTDMIGLLPSLGGGTNFAFAGAETGPLTGVVADPNEVSMLEQVNGLFIPSLGGASAPSDALYVVAHVGNDIRRGLEVYAVTLETEIISGTDLATAMTIAQGAAVNLLSDSVGNIETIIGALEAKGAKDFLVFGGADIGLVPAVTLTNPPNVALLATQLSLAYNTILNQMLNTLSFDVHRLDLFTLLNQISASPSAFGLANASDSCIVPDVSVCSNPDQYLFWDGIHLTTAGQQILTKAVRNAVPAPATLLLLMIGLAGIACRSRRRHS